MCNCDCPSRRHPLIHKNSCLPSDPHLCWTAGLHSPQQPPWRPPRHGGLFHHRSWSGSLVLVPFQLHAGTFSAWFTLVTLPKSFGSYDLAQIRGIWEWGKGGELIQLHRLIQLHQLYPPQTQDTDLCKKPWHAAFLLFYFVQYRHVFMLLAPVDNFAFSLFSFWDCEQGTKKLLPDAASGACQSSQSLWVQRRSFVSSLTSAPGGDVSLI